MRLKRYEYQQQPIGILTFPGSNCDADYEVFKKHFQISLQKIYEQNSDMSPYQGVIPGGFSFGDYLRAGELAVMSPVINSLKLCEKRWSSSGYL